MLKNMKNIEKFSTNYSWQRTIYAPDINEVELWIQIFRTFETSN